jgi:hypothetical protein
MKTTNLTPKQERQRQLMVFLPLIVLPFLTLLFWALGGGKGNQADAQITRQKGFNSSLPDAKLKDNSTLNKMSYYDKAAQDSDKLRQQMKTDPYYHAKADTDTSGLHFPRLNQPAGGSALIGSTRSSQLIGSGSNPAQNEAKVYQKLAELQTTINKPAPEPKAVTGSVPDYSSPLKSQPIPEDPQLKQMGS